MSGIRRILDERFDTVIALLIALATVMSAVVAWRAATAADAANNADAAALAASIKAEEARTVGLVTLYQHYRAYTDHVRYNELGNAIERDLAEATEEEAEALRREMTEAWDLATEIQGGSFFDPRYVDTAGSYDRERELGGLLADAARSADVDPGPHFAAGEALRTKSLLIISHLFPLALALWLLTYSGAGARRRPLAAVLGVVALVYGVTGVVVFEVFLSA